MEERSLLSGDVSGTTAMTVLNHVVSTIRTRNFREPEILGSILCEVMPDLRTQYYKIARLNVNYAIGFMFTMLYAKLWNDARSNPHPNNGMILGALAGLAGVLGGKLLIGLTKKSPYKKTGHLFRNLWIAHLALGVASGIAYKLLDREAYKARKTKRHLKIVQ